MRQIIFIILSFFIINISNAQVPYTESFETDFGIWTQSGGAINWQRTNSPTPTSGTGPAVASEGNYCIFAEATGNLNQYADLSATFNFSGLTMPILSFDYHLWGIGCGNLYVSVNDGSGWTDVFIKSNNQGNYWYNEKVCLDAYKGKTNVVIRIRAEIAETDQSDIAVDNLEIRDFKYNSINSSPVTCGGYADGEISIYLAGGFSPYEYSTNDGIDYTSDNNTNHTFTGLSGGDYLIRVRDESGCELDGPTVNIYEPASPDITYNKTDVEHCSYSHNGIIEIIATGDGQPFTYSIDGTSGPFQSSETFTGLDTGQYQIAVKTTNGCIALGQIVTINAPSDILILDMMKNDVNTCFGDCNGNLQIFAGGGNSPIEYSIDEGVNFDNSNYFNDLCAGSYRIIIRDSKNCLDTSEYIEITEPEFLEITNADVSHILVCNGDDDGSIIATATGGTGTIEYSIDNGYIYQDNNNFDNLSAGMYHLVARDQKNCFFDWGEIEITQPDLLLIDSVVTEDVAGCFGDTDGEIHIYAQGGTGALQYSIDAGTNLQSSSSFFDLSVGDYYPYIVDQNGCERTAPFVSIDEPEPLEITDVLTFDVSDCFGDSSGIVQIFASLGTPPYQYSIDGGATYQTDYSFINLPADTYYPTILDNNGCDFTWSEVTISEPDEIIIEDQYALPTSCFGSNDGEIYVFASGGTGSLMYSVDSALTFPNINGVEYSKSAGTYYIAIRDDSDCIVYGSELVIEEPDSLSIDSATIVDVLGCYGDLSGSITLHVSGGSEPYEYSINNGLEMQTSNLFDELPAQIGYLPFIRDSHGCLAMYDPLVISQPAQLSVTNISHTDIDTCFGVPIGTLNVGAFGGTGNTYFSIDNGITFFDNGGSFTDLYAGVYSIVIKDDNDCITIGWDEEIFQPDTLVIDTITYSDVTCNGQGNGTIFIYADGGQPQLNYSINGGLTFSPSNQFVNVMPGSYDIVVKDQFNCRVADYVELEEPTLFVLDSVVKTDVETCYGANSGMIKVYATGGVEPIQYSYTRIGLGSSDFQESNVFQNLSAGSYFVTIMDANGCTETSVAFSITQPDQVYLEEYSATNISCHGLNDGIIELVAIGGNGEYEYSIDNGTTWFDNGGVFSGLSDGQYQVTAKDTNGCISSIHPVLNVFEPAQIQINDVIANNPTCHNYDDGVIEVQPIGGTGSYAYVMNDIYIQTVDEFDSLSSGLYWFTVYDINFCVAQSDTFELVNPESLAQFTVSQTEGCSPLEVQFARDIEGVIFKWIFEEGDTSVVADPLHYYINNTESTNYITATVVASYALCSDTTYVDFEVYSQPNLYFDLDTNIHYYPDTTVFITNNTIDLENYQWDFGDGGYSTQFQPISHTYSGCGNYDISLSAQNEFGCIDTTIQTLTITTVEPEASFSMDNFAGCAPLDVNFTNISANALRYEWYIDDELLSEEISPSEEFVDAGYFDVLLKAFSYCNTVSEYHASLNVHATPIVDFKVEEPDTVAIGQEVLFENYTTGNNYYIWEFGDGLYSTEFSPRRSYNNSGLFDVTLRAYDKKTECSDSLTQYDVVFVSDSLFIIFPTAFSPDGDGLNDYFEPVTNMVANCTLEIYTRRGQLIFRTEDYDTELWDGTAKGKLLPIDTYVWRAVGRFMNGRYFEEVGEVTIIR